MRTTMWRQLRKEHILSLPVESETLLEAAERISQITGVSHRRTAEWIAQHRRDEGALLRAVRGAHASATHGLFGDPRRAGVIADPDCGLFGIVVDFGDRIVVQEAPREPEWVERVLEDRIGCSPPRLRQVLTACPGLVQTRSLVAASHYFEQPLQGWAGEYMDSQNLTVEQLARLDLYRPDPSRFSCELAVNTEGDGDRMWVLLDKAANVYLCDFGANQHAVRLSLDVDETVAKLVVGKRPQQLSRWVDRNQTPLLIARDGDETRLNFARLPNVEKIAVYIRVLRRALLASDRAPVWREVHHVIDDVEAHIVHGVPIPGDEKLGMRLALSREGDNTEFEPDYVKAAAGGLHEHLVRGEETTWPNLPVRGDSATKPVHLLVAEDLELLADLKGTGQQFDPEEFIAAPL